MKELKYLAALSIPASASLSLYYEGAMSYFTPFFAFIIIPALELIVSEDNSSVGGDILKRQANRKIYDWFLYINIPVVFGLLGYALWDISVHLHEYWEIIGLALSLGIVLGTNGINVAHELGHRSYSNEKLLGKLLLLPSFYMHFFIEHNFGHHRHAATREDPATALYNQTVYSFWLTSVYRQYLHAWHLQRELLKSGNHSFLSLKNDMLWYTILQLTYLLGVAFLFGTLGMVFALIAGISSFLLLQTVNYIEHYGLLRTKGFSGRYERVQEIHSWNSNHVIGRVMLYELTRHSDHHYKSTKKYQTLGSHPSSPQMPYGYPTSMVLSLLPPIWFRIMNPKIPKEMRPVS